MIHAIKPELIKTSTNWTQTFETVHKKKRIPKRFEDKLQIQIDIPIANNNITFGMTSNIKHIIFEDMWAGERERQHAEHLAKFPHLHNEV